MEKNIKQPAKKAKKIEEKSILDTMPKLKISIFFQSILYTLMMIAIFGSVGYYLDAKHDTAPKMTIVAVAISYPLTQILLLKRMRKFVTKKVAKK